MSWIYLREIFICVKKIAMLICFLQNKKAWQFWRRLKRLFDVSTYSQTESVVLIASTYSREAGTVVIVKFLVLKLIIWVFIFSRRCSSQRIWFNILAVKSTRAGIILCLGVVAARLRSLRTDDPLSKRHSWSINQELELWRH